MLGGVLEGLFLQLIKHPISHVQQGLRTQLANHFHPTRDHQHSSWSSL